MKEKKSCFHEAKEIFTEYKILLRNIPSIIVTLFVLSVVVMNLLANKTIFQNDYIALDGGFIISWMAFLSMDIITKHYGPKASTMVSIFATVVNLFMCLIFYIVSIIPTDIDYNGFNTIFGGTWFILLSSTIAFISSAIINNFINYSLRRLFNDNDTRISFYTRSYISTFIGQFFDNLIFALLTFMVFAPIFWDGFSWSFIQCLTCSIIGAIFELVLEIIFSPLGYRISRSWKKNNIGKEYFIYIKEKKNENIN